VQALRNHHVSRNVNDIHRELSSFGDRLSDQLAELGGSWTFIVGFLSVLVLWMGLNTFQLLVAPFDPFPFIFLNLVLSCLAAIQAPVILMSQNRQAAHDRISAEHDYEVNLKAEMQVEELHKKLDTLRDEQWAELVQLQQREIELLERIIVELTRPAIPPAQGRAHRVSASRPVRAGTIEEVGS
jgi:uncharacterized membrane protein